MKGAVCLLLALVFGVCYGAITRSGDAKQRTELFRQLMKNYEKDVNPDATTLKFGVALLGVTLNDKMNLMETDAWLRYSWTDSRLTWDTQKFPIDVLRMTKTKIWVPDMSLYNSAELYKTESNCWDSNVLIYPNGNVLWVPPCRLVSYCPVTPNYAPKNCTMKFGSWTFDATILDVDFYDNKPEIDVTYFTEDLSDFKIIGNTAEKITKYYPTVEEPYSSLNYNITFMRKKDNKWNAPILESNDI